MRYLDLVFLAVLFLLIPWLAYRFGKDSRNGIESDAYQRRKSRGA
jgi:hypothetical protein